MSPRWSAFVYTCVLGTLVAACGSERVTQPDEDGGGSSGDTGDVPSNDLPARVPSPPFYLGGRECRPRCGTDAECQEGVTEPMVCYEGGCVRVICSTTGFDECQGSGYGGTCDGLWCASQCGTGDDCEVGDCVDQLCVLDACQGCTELGVECLEPLFNGWTMGCRSSCDSDLDCTQPGYHQCDDGWCTPDLCFSDLDCAASEVCR